MPLVNETELKTKIKNNEIANLTFIYGDELYLKGKYCNAILKKIVNKEMGEYGFQRFEGDEFDADAFMDTVESFPMLGGRKCVLVNDLDVDKLTADKFDILIDVISDVPDYCYVIFKTDSVSVDGKKAKWKKFVNTVKDNGIAAEIKSLDNSSAVKMLKSEAKRRKRELGNRQAQYIVELCGLDMQTLINEIEKICAYCDEEEIKMEHISAVAVKTVDAKIYDLSKAIIRKDSKTAFGILDSLFYMKIEPIIILATISGNFVDMYRCRCAVVSGLVESDISNVFPQAYKGREFKIRNAIKDSKRISAENLNACIDTIYEADLRLKSSRTDNRIIIEQLISKLFFITSGGR